MLRTTSKPSCRRRGKESMTRTHFILVAMLASLALPDAARAEGTRLLRRPAVSRELVAFEYGGDLWSVPRSGGQARRLTSTPGVEIDPRFSPDGSRLAFTVSAKAVSRSVASGRRLSTTSSTCSRRSPGTSS